MVNVSWNRESETFSSGSVLTEGRYGFDVLVQRWVSADGSVNYNVRAQEADYVRGNLSLVDTLLDAHHAFAEEIGTTPTQKDRLRCREFLVQTIGNGVLDARNYLRAA